VAERHKKPARDLKDQENRMISLAVNLAESQLRAGTASPLVISHYLKLGSSREKLEQAKITKETALLEARTEDLANNQATRELLNEAIKAFSVYSGAATDDPDLQ